MRPRRSLSPTSAHASASAHVPGLAPGLAWRSVRLAARASLCGVALALVGSALPASAEQVRRPGAGAPAPVVKRPPVVRAAVKQRTDQEVLNDAQDAYARGERQTAIDLALQIAEKENTYSPVAWRFIGLAACSVRAARMATRAYNSLQSADDQRMVVETCSANGLGLRGEGFSEN